MTKTLTPQQIYRKRADGLPLGPNDEEIVQRHVISVLLENQSGSLNRVLNMFAARGFNVESVTVGETQDPSMSRLTLVTSGNTRIIRQVVRQLNRLVETLEVNDLSEGAFVEREICLMKVGTTAESRTQVKETADIFGAKVIDITPSTLTFEVTGPTTKIKAFMNVMQQDFQILEVARSGRVALSRPLVAGD